MTGLRVAWRGSALFLHLLLGLIMTPLVARRDRETGLWRTDPQVACWWHGRVARIFRLEISRSGELPKPPALLVSNHVSWLDIIVLGHLAPTCFLSKDEVRRWPVIGWMAERAGTLFIRRGGGQAADISQQIGMRLGRHGLLTLFPEGTTTDGRDVRPFFSRLFAASIDTGTPIVPTSIRYRVDGHLDPVAPYIDDQTLGGSILSLLRRPGSQVHVHFSAPIALQNTDRNSLAKLTRKTIVEALEPLDSHDLPLAESQRNRPS